MKFMKPLFLGFLAFALTLTLQVEVFAEETTPSPAPTVPSLVLEVNDPEALTRIKEALVASILPPTGEKINLDTLEIHTENLDLTQPGEQLTKVLVIFHNAPTTPDTLVKNTLSMSIRITLVDTIAPDIELQRSTETIEIDTEFNPWLEVSYVFDNSTKNVWENLVVDSNVDVHTEGEYLVTYTVTDPSGNQTQVELPVTVTKDPVPYTLNIEALTVSDDDIATMLGYINALREENGLAPLALADSYGQQAAALRAQEAASYLSHTRPDGSHYKTAFADVGGPIPASPWEILTYAGSTVYDKFNWWFNSSGHRYGMLLPNATTIALGQYNGLWCGIIY